MKILVAADMEGVSGVTHWEETDPSHGEYSRFRKLMTEEVNAAIAGAAEAGVDEFVVADGHGDGTNILIEILDPRARLNSGNGSPFSMIQGVDPQTAGVFFIGYHARAGSERAVLAHTWSSGRIANVWLNDVLVGEYGLNAAVAGHHGVPVLMISGDQTACGQAVELLGPLECAVVKQATGYYSAECLTPTTTQPMIQAAARRAVERLKAGTAPKPYNVQAPVRLVIEFRQPESIDRVTRMAGAERQEGMKVQFTLPDMLRAHACFRAAVKEAFD